MEKKNTFKITLNNKRNGEVLTSDELNFLRHLNLERLNNEINVSNKNALINLQGKLERIWEEHLVAQFKKYNN